MLDERQVDVLVVGGGPAGAAVARDIALAGWSVLIAERDVAIGKPVQCSGLVTHRTLVTAGLSPSMTNNALTGAAVYSPRRQRYEIGGDRVHAYILDRTKFDEGMMEQALAAGVELFNSTRVVSLSRDDRWLRIQTERGGRTQSVRARLVIGADGPRSLVASFLGLPPPSEFLRARGADVRLPRRPATDQVQIFAGERYAPGFFAWAIPFGDDRYRIGWGIGRASAETQHLENLIADFPEIFHGIEVLTQTGGLIPLGPRPRTFGDGGMVVGDAAGQAKATSGGGLYTSLTCATHCARVAIEALASDDTSAARLSAYDRAWRADIGQELDRATILREAYRTLSDDDLEWGLRMLRLPRMRHIVDRYGDIDYPSRLSTVVLRTAPTLLRFLSRRGSAIDTQAVDDPVPAWAPNP